MKTIYETKATAIGGRNGLIKSEDGVINMKVRIPTKLGGKGGNYTNPEQLFASGYAACFDSALNHIATINKLNIESTTSATIGLAKKNDSYQLTASLEVKIEGINAEAAKKLVDKAHTTCPYSNAIKNNIDVKINLI